MKNIAMIVYDFDGVLTDNRVWVGEDGKESVACNRSDGWWIGKLKELQIPQLILSTEKNFVVSARGAKLGLEVLQGQADKKSALEHVVQKASLPMSKVCYIGNEMNDYECMKIVGHPLAPSDSHPEILKIAKYILPVKGGEGIVRHLYDWIFMEAA